MEQDPVSLLIDRVADAVVRKLDEQQKIDAIARAVIDRLHESDGSSATTKTPKRPPAHPSKPSRVGARRVVSSNSNRGSSQE